MEHRRAEDQYRRIGLAAPALLLIPETGDPTLALLPPSGPPPRAYLQAAIRTAGAVALVLTCEAWAINVPDDVGSGPIEALPLPARDPRREGAIVSFGVLPTPDGPLSVIRGTRIRRGAFGTVLEPEPDTYSSVRTGDGTTAWLASLFD